MMGMDAHPFTEPGRMRVLLLSYRVRTCQAGNFWPGTSYNAVDESS